MKSYMANIDGWVAGHRVKPGDIVVLTDAQALYAQVTEIGVPPLDNPLAIRLVRRRLQTGAPDGVPLHEWLTRAEPAPEPTVQPPVKAPRKRKPKA